MASRIHIKLGQLEIEYEGDAEFLKSDLLEIVKKLTELHNQAPVLATPTRQSQASVPAPTAKLNHSTDTIATVLKADSGSELALAAAAHLTLVKEKQSFTRQELIDEMRSAPGHFKETYVNNLSSSLKTLTKSEKLRLVGSDTYSLSNNERQSIGVKIADA